MLMPGCLRASLLSLIMICFAAPEFAAAEEESEPAPLLAIGAEATFDSRYTWRGIALSRGAVLQPAAYLTVRGLTFEFWSNFDLEPENLQRHYNETDLTVSYKKEWGRFSLEPSLQSYLFPRDVESANTAEAAFRFGYLVGPVEIFTRHGFDVAEFRGAYFGETGVEWARQLRDTLELSAAASVGWADEKFNASYLDTPKGALNLMSFEVGLSWQPTRNLQIRPHFGLSSLMDRSLRKSSSEPDLRLFGLTLSADF